MKKTLEAAFTHLGFRCSVFLADISDELKGSSYSVASVWYCGYVEVPDGHPYCGCAYDEVPAGRRDLPSPNDGLDAPGGINYSARSKCGWMFGFSCGEDGDAPGSWTVSRVGVECRKLATRLHTICKAPPAGNSEHTPKGKTCPPANATNVATKAPAKSSTPTKATQTRHSSRSMLTGRFLPARARSVVQKHKGSGRGRGKPTGMKNITRYDYTHTGFSGYRFTKSKDRVSITLYLSDRWYGGKDAALAATMAVKAEVRDIVSSCRTLEELAWRFSEVKKSVAGCRTTYELAADFEELRKKSYDRPGKC